MKQRCHFIGIGGIGMSGLARLLLSRNHQVTGSDIASNYVTEALVKAGANVFKGQSEDNISSDMTVVYSTDIKDSNPEYQAALKLKCPMLHRSDLLKQLMLGYKTLAVAGTHGKTTTSSMLAWVLTQCGLDPSFAVGGMIPQLHSNAGHGKGSYFVAEACESDGTYLKYDCEGAIVTNIDLDHMNYFQTEEALIDSFKQFMSKAANKKLLFWCFEDERLKKLNMPGISYGFAAGSQLRASRLVQKGWSIHFDVDFKGRHYSAVEVPLVGVHNALNSLAVFGMALELGIEEASIRKALTSFGGVLRRCEKKGERKGILLLDDYAHHPTEIETTLKGIKKAVGERRLVAIFQPHRFTRTRDCLGYFKHVFDAADEIFITDLFSAGEEPISGVSANAVFEEIKRNSLVPCHFAARPQLAQTAAEFLRPHDVVVTLGAGDITKVSGEILAHFDKKPPQKLKVGVIFGGRSMEHEVSQMSSQYVFKSLDSDIYDVSPFKISKEGRWKIENDEEAEAMKHSLLPVKVVEKLHACDVFFPVMHGPYCEDGTLQGLLDMLDKAYVGCNHRASAIAMDKVMTKRLASLQGIPVLPFVAFDRFEWQSKREAIEHEIQTKLAFPVFVKPNHLGSSIGVSKVSSFNELEPAVVKALSFDYEIVVETGVVAREIEFAVIGNHEIEVLPPGEIMSNGNLHDYEGKYSANATPDDARAKLTPQQIEEGMDLARRTFQAIGGTGLSRIDFFLDQSGQYWMNEVNPLPGMTKNSMYPRMTEANGITGKELIDKLLVLALERKRFQRTQVIKRVSE